MLEFENIKLARALKDFELLIEFWDVDRDDLPKREFAKERKIICKTLSGLGYEPFQIGEVMNLNSRQVYDCRHEANKILESARTYNKFRKSIKLFE